MRLSHDTVVQLARSVQRPRHDPATEKVGMVHLGIGAFLRRHQAVHADDALGNGDRNWRVTGVSQRSAQAQDELAPHAGLFTVTSKARQKRRHGSSDRSAGCSWPRRTAATLADPAVQVVTMKITEKGYHLVSDETLDLSADAIRRDLSGEPPVTTFGFLARVLAGRRAQRCTPLTLLSCDNLAGNGRKLADALVTLLTRTDPRLTDWVMATCRFPSSMVDRIVPAATAAMRDDIRARIGMADAAATRTEPFRQWVIEDRSALFGAAGLFRAQWRASSANRRALTDHVQAGPKGCGRET